MASTLTRTSLENEQYPLLAVRAANADLLRDTQVEIRCHLRRAEQLTGNFFFLQPTNNEKLAELHRIRDRVEFLRRQEKLLQKTL